MTPPSPAIKKIACFGFAGAPPEDPLYKEAFECAKFLAQQGYTIVNGGGPGVMRATSEGAKAAKGFTIGVTFYPKDVANFEGRDPNNPLDKEIITKNYLERTLKLLEEGDCYIVFKGGTGTLSEFGMAWGLAQLYFGHHKPLILYGKFWENIMAPILSNMRILLPATRAYKIVDSPQDTLTAIKQFEDMYHRPDKPYNEEEAPFQL